MKKFLFIILIVFIGSFTSAQKNPPLTNRKDFFSLPHFKNGKAVLSFKAIYCSLYEDAPRYAFKDFHKYKTLLSTPIYSGSVISFKPQGDTTAYNAPYVSRNVLVNKLKIGTSVYLTIVIFENYPGYETRHFFVVTDISQIAK